MAQVKFELEIKESEKAFTETVSELVKAHKGEDCRSMRSAISFINDAAGKPYVIGCGGSHIWIHRRADHVEGRPVESQRFAIITD